MFSNYSLTFALVGTASAITREPLLSWKATNKKANYKTPYEMDYFVPNFGVDRDIKATNTNLADSERVLKHKWNVTKEQLNPKPFKDYTVPNFGVDHDIESTHANLADAETSLGHKWSVTPKKDLPKPHPVDYFVPNFGQDRDIKTSFTDLDWAEKSKKHQWVVTQEDLKKDKVEDYRVPNFGLDADILATQAHQDYSEKKLGTNQWNPEPYLNNHLQVNEESSDDQSESEGDENVQLGVTREPLLTWEPELAHTHEMNYFVPNFGVDHGIKESLDNAALAEKITGHKWQYIDPKDRPKPHKTDYFVPNFGQDTDVKQTLDLAAKAETKLKHKWNYVPKKLRAKEPKRDYFVPNFGEDPEIQDTNESEVQAQTEVWSARLGSQIGEDEAAAQIATDAATYRADAEKAQREADAAAAKAAAAEADAQVARDKAVENDFKDKMRANLEAASASEAKRVAEYNAQEEATRTAYAASQVEKEKDHAYYLEETRKRTQDAYAADAANNAATIAAAKARDEEEAAYKAKRDADLAEKDRLAAAVRVEQRQYMIDQRISGMKEAASAQDIDLAKERQKQAEIKAAEDRARAKFWEEYERLHGASRQLDAKKEADKEAAEAEAEKVKELAEKKDAAERQKADEESAARAVKEAAEADAATKRAIADQAKIEDAAEAKQESDKKADEEAEKKEAAVRKAAVEETQKENESIQRAVTEKIDEAKSHENKVAEMIKADKVVNEEADAAEKVQKKEKEVALEKSKAASPPELIKSIAKESAEKAGMKVVNEDGTGPLELVPKTAALPLQPNGKKAKKAAPTTGPAELLPPSAKNVFDDEDFHISI